MLFETRLSTAKEACSGVSTHRLRSSIMIVAFPIVGIYTDAWEAGHNRQLSSNTKR